MAKKTLSKADRIVAVDLFTSIVAPKVASSTRTFTPAEREATEIIAGMVKKIGGGFKKSGRQRDDTNPSKQTLYFRWNRARKALAEAEAAGLGNGTLRNLKREVRETEAAYRAHPGDE